MATRTSAVVDGHEDQRPPPPGPGKQPDREPRSWQLTARCLVRAANVLYDAYPKVRVHDPACASLVPVLVLYGLATENLIKGLLTAQGWRTERDDRLQSHHLAWLFEQAKVSLSVKDAEVVERLQWFFEKGRYPHEVQPAGEQGGEVARLLRLLTRLEDELAAALPDKALPRISLFGLGRDGSLVGPAEDLAPEADAARSAAPEPSPARL
jgi:hypothetical protein